MMPRNSQTTGTESEAGPENPIAASVHRDNHPRPGRLAMLKRFLRRVFITLSLIGVVAIPLLLYFTDVAPPLKQEMRKLVAEYSIYRKTSQELSEAKQKISALEEELAGAKLEPIPIPPTRPAATPDSDSAGKTDSETQPAISTRKRENETVITLRNGVSVRRYVDIGHGEIASSVRGRKEAYELETRLKINHPAANKTISELGSLNPELPKILPGLKELLAEGRVSPLFDKIYELKIERVVGSMSSPVEMETRHNFFDCETILALTHPRTKEKVLLMQGEMDVVADGTDGDRWPYLNEAIAGSKYFQHATSYRWKKKSETPNPLLERARDDLKKVLARYAVKGLSKTENANLQSRRDELRRHIREMQSTSFLIAEIDPFIVLPLSFLNQSKLSHAPSIGDFAVVIYKDKVYPAICGDAGPPWKLGEGSLFLARTLNPKSTPNIRPVSDLKVTYLVFPGTKPGKSDQPDLIGWRKQCQDLLNGIGGLGEGYQLHNWRDLSDERRSMNELEKLAGEFAPIIEKCDKAVAEAKKDLAAAGEKIRQLGKEITKLEEQEQKDEPDASTDEPGASKSTNGEQDDAEKLRGKLLSAGNQKIVLENELKQAGQSAATARELHERTKAAIESARAIAELPESTPRDLSTDIVLAALAESKAAVEMLKVE